MHIVEDDAHRVIANRMQFQDRHVALAANGPALGRRMALHLGARAAHAQIFRRQFEALAVVNDTTKVLRSFCRRSSVGQGPVGAPSQSYSSDITRYRRAVAVTFTPRPERRRHAPSTS